MKKNLLAFCIAGYLLITLSSCEKDATEVPLVSNKPISGIAAPIVPPPNPSPAPGGGSTSTTYQPLTAGSYWKYSYTTLGSPLDTGITTISGKTTLIKGNTYYEANQTSKNFGAQKGYYYNNNHTYSQRGDTYVHGLTVELLYLNDTASVGQTWIAPFTDNGLVNGIPARIVGKVVEKDMSRTVEGNTFKNVIHTSLDLQYWYASAFETAITYHMYIAKGVGIIETSSEMNGSVSSTSKLIEYSIK
jgi:hypothetical protein